MQTPTRNLPRPSWRELTPKTTLITVNADSARTVDYRCTRCDQYCFDLTMESAIAIANEHYKQKCQRARY